MRLSLAGIGRIVGIAVLCLLVLVLVLRVLLPNESVLGSAANTLERYRYWLMAARLAAIGLIWWYWDRVLELYFGDRAPASLAYLKSRRHFYAGVLIVIELVIAQNVIGRILGWVL